MNSQKLSEAFGQLAKMYEGKAISFEELSKHLNAKTQAIATLVLSLPFVFFIPLPGPSIVFGIFICFNGFRIASKKKLWFPSFLKTKRIPASVLSKALHFAERWSLRLEKVVKPRGKFFTTHSICVRINGSIFCAAGFLLALPLPPGTNFLPGLNVLILSLGVLEEDNLMILLGYSLFCVNLFLYLVLPALGLLLFKR